MSESSTGNSEVYKQVVTVISKVLGIAQDVIKPESNFVNDLGADSLDRVTLVMALEDAFKRQIPEEDLDQLTTVDSTVTYIEKHLLAKSQP
ncbi:MAG: acyl carrier protein [Verrucomicrobia bacterium GWF2_62_7]|nr:acyl carrier protein [Verrucomicrobiota bacterium]OHE76159.1 MAG: acyl carrier protein [Verrucomicrobia bacterium GWF2_62_7]